MYVPLRTSIRFSSCGAHYGVMNPQRDVREGFEPTMSNHKGLGTMPHYTPDKPDSSAFYSQLRGIVYNLARYSPLYRYWSSSLVLEEGLEPSQPTGQQSLNLSCLPFHHPSILKSYFLFLTIKINKTNNTNNIGVIILILVVRTGLEPAYQVLIFTVR